MVDRIQITQLTYMNVEGQPQLIDKGSVVDVPDGSKFHASSATPLVEAAGTLDKPTHTKEVRNMRKR